LGIWGIRSFIASLPDRRRFNLQVVLTTKENPRTRSKTIAAIWDRVFALARSITRGLSKILISSFRVEFERSKRTAFF
jgi:hypothetical protein